MRRNQRKIKEARKSSHQLFLQAKRRFQYRPNPKRLETPAQTINSPECSSVTDGNKQEHSNDFSWLDKMVSGFEWYGTKDQQHQQENKSRLSALSQPKTSYFAKKRTALAEKSLNKQNTTSAGKPVIKRSLEKSVEHRQKLHKAIVTEKPNKGIQQFDVKDFPEEDVAEEECPHLFSARKEEPPKEEGVKEEKKDDLCTLMRNLSTEPLEVDVTILKVEEPHRNRLEQKRYADGESHVHPTPEKSPDEIRDKPVSTRQLGKIKRNCASKQEVKTPETRSEPKLEPKPEQKFEIYQPRRKSGVSLIEPYRSTSLVQPIQLPTSKSQIQKSGNLTYFRETIQEEEEERSCQNSGRLEQKFREIFVELDQGKHGYIDRANCCGESINDEIRYLIGPVLSKIKYQDKRYTLQTFIEEAKRILSALEAHEVSKLLKCSVINRLFFLDTKRSQLDRRTISNTPHDRRSYSTVVKNYSGNDYGEVDLDHIRQRSVGNNSIIEDHPAELAKIPEPVVQRINSGMIRSGISRQPYLRISMGRSSDRQQEPSNEDKSLVRWRGGSVHERADRSSHEQISRQVYLNRDSRKSPLKHQHSVSIEPVEIASPIKPIQRAAIQPYEKELLEREQCNRIDLLNERLNHYIQENHLRSAQRAGQFDSISLQFAELRKHLRP